MPKLQIYNRKTMHVIAEQDVEEKDGGFAFPSMLPDIPMSDIVVLIDGQMAKIFPKMPPKREIVGEDQIVESFWSYGKDHKPLSDQTDSKLRYDLNLHIKLKEGNNGKELRLVVDTDDNMEIPLKGIISENEVVFDNVFDKSVKN